jgi:hypothetical protein
MDRVRCDYCAKYASITVFGHTMCWQHYSEWIVRMITVKSEVLN